MINYADIIVDLQAGDTGKGKVAHALSQKKDEYTHVVRYNGGGNAGHTLYHNGKKFVTHYVPVGVFYGIKSIIGPGCVVNLDNFVKEIMELEQNGIKVIGNLFIDKRVHVVTDKHIKEDSQDIKIGTTKTGNGPCYRDKYVRNGVRAEEFHMISDMITDIYHELHNEKITSILFEGAQGFELDIDWGDYPYVTSSHCTVGSAILNGVPPQKIRNIYGICKGYNTYVGAKKYQKNEKIFDKIREIGNEYGSTTGRPRQIGWNNMNTIIMASNINGVTDLIINKMDVLDKVGIMKLEHNGKTISFKTISDYKKMFVDLILSNCPTVKSISFSESAEKI